MNKVYGFNEQARAPHKPMSRPMLIINNKNDSSLYQSLTMELNNLNT